MLKEKRFQHFPRNHVAALSFTTILNLLTWKTRYATVPAIRPRDKLSAAIRHLSGSTYWPARIGVTPWRLPALLVPGLTRDVLLELGSCEAVEKEERRKIRMKAKMQQATAKF